MGDECGEVGKRLRGKIRYGGIKDIFPDGGLASWKSPCVLDLSAGEGDERGGGRNGSQNADWISQIVKDGKNRRGGLGTQCRDATFPKS